MAVDSLPIPLTWILLAILPVLFYIYAVRPLQLFKKMGVPGPTPWPIIGNLLDHMKDGVWNIESQVKRRKKYGSVYGMYGGGLTAIFITDPEMLQDIFVKKFHSFTNRQPKDIHLRVKPVGRMLTQLVDEDWKNVRSTISPAFSGGKLKQMAGAMNSCAGLLVENIGKFADTGESFEVKELTGAFTMDVITRTAFGTQIDSQKNPDDPFVVYARRLIDRPISIFALMFMFFPSLLVPCWRGSSTTFFYSVFDQLMELRQAEGQERVDFLQLMMNAHKEHDETGEAKSHGHKQPLTKDDVVANGILFFIAGYETTATTMAFTLYNLALNQGKQDKLRQEITQVMADREFVDNEDVHKMPYLEMCISETLRMYSPAAMTTRASSEEVKLKWLTIPKDMLVAAPILAIHYDPERWPEPYKFIPERFTKEEKEKRGPYDWMPFGAGPRNCIGMRLALFELKLGLARLLMKYRVMTAPDTDIPLKMKKFKKFPIPENGIRLKVELVDSVTY
ncbi:cytochrome P450 3A6-like [Branchiostoma floridae]|uniref:Cytochrome P450 3A6-like n=1 Tax=Branchiostoma floridae TaxID=7739 RepID=A0A9J7ND44_BRAFL|nr:cytochrome P450 3A6-like [Branchiostoma floridae]